MVKKQITQQQVNKVFMASAEYKEMKKEVEGVKKELTKLCNKVDKTHLAIVGDLTLGQDGIVRMVKAHEKWINSQRYMYAKIYGGTIAVATLVSLLAKFWDKIF